MEKPYVQLAGKPLAAPLEEMEEIVLSTLTASGFGHFNYSEHPKRIYGTKAKREIWGGRQFTKDYAVEVKWKEDCSPPAAFAQMALSNPHINPLLVNLQLKNLNSTAQQDAKKYLEELWVELKKRACETSEAMTTTKSPVDHGMAEWASLAQLANEGYVQEQAEEEISNRLVLGTLQGQLITVPKRFTEAHAIVQGPPGSGKSRTIINTQLIERLKTSAIVTEVTAGEDLTPTVYGITAGFRAKHGHQVFYINPSDLNNSTRFNPVDFIETVDDAIYYSDLIITNTTFNNHIGDQIWTQSEHHLLTALLLYVWGLGGKKKSIEGGKSNIGHIRSLLRLGPGGVGSVVANDGIPEAKNQFDEFLRNSSPNFRLGVFSGLIQRLNPWLNPRIRALTEVSDFDPEELRRNLFTFYLAYPVHRRDYRPIMSLALNFLTRLPLRKKFEHPLTYILDEFAAYGRIPGIDDMQATIRNRRIGIVLGFQDINQLTKVYSHHEAEVLFTNCDTKIIFATGSPKSQSQISQMLGQTTKIKKSVSSSGHVSRHTYGAPLLAPADIGRIPEQHIVVIRNKRNPIILNTCEPGKYEHYAQEFPPPKGKQKIVPKAIYEECVQANNLEFSKTIAEQQVLNFERCYKSKLAAFAALRKAKIANSPQAQLLLLEQQAQKAQATYRALFGQLVADQEIISNIDKIDGQTNQQTTQHKEISEQHTIAAEEPYDYFSQQSEPYLYSS